MTYEQFWNDCPELYYIYEEAYIDKLKERDMFQWQMGIYLKMAVSSCFDKNAQYPKEAMFFNKKERPKTDEDMRDIALGLIAQINAQF